MAKSDDRIVVDTRRLQPQMFFGSACVGGVLMIENHFFKIVSVKLYPTHQELTLVTAKTVASHNFKVIK